jgi:trehalose synthase
MIRDPYRPSKRSFAEVFFPERPQQLWKKARAGAKKRLRRVRHIGPATALNTAYIRWLERESMLANAHKQALSYSGRATMWHKPFARPRPRAAINLSSVWYTAYPASLITRRKETILQALADEDLWKTFQQIGIQGVHTGPLKIAGGLQGWKETPSVDGHFDRVSNQIDPLFGTEDQFRRLAEIAAPHGGIVIDDIVPGHTGKGADFRLAEMNYDGYPGIYHMIEIHSKDWHLLPDVPQRQDSVNLSPETEERLKQAGYIIGRTYRVIFYEPGIKETNWSVTRPVIGVDGVRRRWVYLHYFKEGQPSINWLDPTFAGMQLVIGDALHSLGELGARGLRLDANGYLGIEKGDGDTPAWSEGHPLSEAANHLIASMVRKVGGFTFQELNLPLEEIKTSVIDGADLSYDFITRPAYHHALATGRVEFLRLMQRTALDIGLDPVSQVHALDNHDELTYELVHFWNSHRDDQYTYRGQTVTGGELRSTVRRELREKLIGPHAPYNQPYTENGIACSTASVITAVLGYKDVDNLTPEQVAKVTQLHLLLVFFNAMQPGVFALSGWDLAGTLPVKPGQVADLIANGDTRWLTRGAYDLMGVDPGARHSLSGLPRATNLYGSLPEQLADERSFTSQLKRILDIRTLYQIPTSRQIDLPASSHPGIHVMLHQLAGERLQLTILNFSDESAKATITSEHLPAEAHLTDMFSGQPVTKIDQKSFTVTLEPHQPLSLLVTHV